jgi:4-amino-4-deoxy-L-arabinose transferase-like glycosyltransferase
VSGSPSAFARVEVRRDRVLLAIGCAVLYGVRLGARDLWNPNEPIYGEAVREMTQLHTWLVPHVNGLPFGEKPILFYWLALLASKSLGGVSELALRVPSALAGLLTVVGVYELVRPYSGRRHALLSAVLCATTFDVWWNARFVQMDILVAVTTLWTLLPLTRILDHRMPRARGWLAAGAVAGVGFLAKGPVTWICPGVAIVAYAATTRRLRELGRIEILLGAAGALTIAAPWYLLLLAGGHADVVREVLIRQNFQRFSNPWDHVAPFWYYVPYFWADMAPWALFVPLAWKLPGRDEPRSKLAILCAVWIVSIVAFFSLSKSKRDPYILPVAPAAAILAAEVALAYAGGALSRGRRYAFLAINVAIALVFVGAGIGVAVKLAPKVPDLLGPARLLAAASVLAGAALAVVLARPRTRRGLIPTATCAAATALLFFVVGGWVMPPADAYKSARPLCDGVARLSGKDDALASYNFWKWRAEYRFYLGRPIDNLPGIDALRAAWGGPRRLVLFVESEQLEAARSVIGDRAPVLARGVGSGKTYVFTNR